MSAAESCISTAHYKQIYQASKLKTKTAIKLT